MDITPKGELQRGFCGEGTVMDLDCNGGHMNLHM